MELMTSDRKLKASRNEGSTGHKRFDQTLVREQVAQKGWSGEVIQSIVGLRRTVLTPNVSLSHTKCF
jgi:hypothetical protein